MRAVWPGNTQYVCYECSGDINSLLNGYISMMSLIIHLNQQLALVSAGSKQGRYGITSRILDRKNAVK